MKKLKWFIAMILACTMIFVGCNNENEEPSDSNSGGGSIIEDGKDENTDENENIGIDSKKTVSLGKVAEGYIRINFESPECTNLWVWDDFASEENNKCASWGAEGVTGKKTNGDYGAFDVKLAENPSQISFIPLKGASSDANKLSANIIFVFPNKYKEIFVTKDYKLYVGEIDAEGKVTYFEPRGISGATITDTSTIKLDGNVNPSKENITIQDSTGKTIAVSTVDKKTVTVDADLSVLGMAIITVTDDKGEDKVTAVPSEEKLAEWYDTDISSFGYKNGVFTTWAPLASSAKVQLFASASDVAKSNIADTIEMTRGEKGIWKTDNVSSKVGGNKYYKYLFKNGAYNYAVCDIWAKVASKDSKATQIVDINDASAKPAGWDTDKNPWTGTRYSDAVIYEMHIRDWSMAFNDNSTGSFAEITAELSKPDGRLYKHLNDLGVTHVQILPMFEWAVYNKTKDDDSEYNWGYNPYNYNTPESRYAKMTDDSDGTEAVKAMREMIKAFHEAGFAVIMDVVYNHTNGTKEGSIYDMTVPKYFYRTTGDTYSDGSGCGNETATNHGMVKAFVIDSLKHWMNDYHINGFRFDLMGIHELSTMKDIYDELYQLDNKVMVYGEPWTGGTAAVVNGAINAVKGNSGNGVGAFDDNFRDALIKGGMAAATEKGQIQGGFDNAKLHKDLISGKSGRNSTEIPGLSIHYVECHDNYTLYDKLVMSNFSKSTTDMARGVSLSENQIETIKAQSKLAAAYIFLSQGTPFINGGQEFMRTKKGNPDSYAADTKGGYTWSEEEVLECNRVNLDLKDTYRDVYNTYKGLIALRKKNLVSFGANLAATAEDVKDQTTKRTIPGVTKYTTEDFLVYFNATDKAVNITTDGYTKAIDVSSGTPKDSALPTQVDAKSFVILKK
ncbi:MAG: hypothetical protein HDR51_06395 [Treponema sp.]|nr:hypothetical protein [Treponema sp.]